MNVFFFNDTATTEIYTLSLHDALPIWPTRPWSPNHPNGSPRSATPGASTATPNGLPVERWLPRRPRRDQPAASDRRSRPSTGRRHPAPVPASGADLGRCQPQSLQHLGSHAGGEQENNRRRWLWAVTDGSSPWAWCVTVPRDLRSGQALSAGMVTSSVVSLGSSTGRNR